MRRCSFCLKGIVAQDGKLYVGPTKLGKRVSVRELKKYIFLTISNHESLENFLQKTAVRSTDRRCNIICVTFSLHRTVRNLVTEGSPCPASKKRWNSPVIRDVIFLSIQINSCLITGAGIGANISPTRPYLAPFTHNSIPTTPAEGGMGGEGRDGLLAIASMLGKKPLQSS